jgi:hypothetical protein
MDMRRENRHESSRPDRENSVYNRDDSDFWRKREDHDSRRCFDRFDDRHLDFGRERRDGRFFDRDARYGHDEDKPVHYEERHREKRRLDDHLVDSRDGGRRDGSFGIGRLGRNSARGPKPRQDPLVELPPSKIRVSELNVDPELRPLADDPRIDSNGVKHRKERGGARNTESFDPASTLVRPDMRVIIGPQAERFGKSLKHDDVVVVPEFFCKENDWTLYYQLVEEMRAIQEKGVPQSEWTAWAEGAHLISHNPSQSQTFQMVT